MSKSFIFLLSLFIGFQSWAGFVIDENSTDSDLAVESMEGHGSIRLLNFKKDKELASPQVVYDRKKHFGKFTRFKKQKSCYNSRALVLIRDSLGPTKSTDKEPCTIEEGDWLDRYTNQKIQHDDQLQVDHLVPLKHAYVSGAHEWSKARRCVYNNFLDFTPHLQLMSGPENASKSDKNPAEYLPKNKDFICDYIKNWLEVKLIWQLHFSEEEIKSIEKSTQLYNCETQNWKMSKSSLSKWRQRIKELEPLCPVTQR